MKNLILIIVFLLLCPSLVLAEGESKSNFKVKLSITAADEDTKQTTESYLSRELRSLGDVTIVDAGEDCELGIVVIESKSVSGAKTVVAFSVVYYEPQNVMDLIVVKGGLGSLLIQLTSLPETEQRQELIKLVTNLIDIMVKACYTVGDYSAKGQMLYTGGIDYFRDRCERIIVDFDNGYLKEKRKAIAEIQAKVYGEGESTKP